MNMQDVDRVVGRKAMLFDLEEQPFDDSRGRTFKASDVKLDRSLVPEIEANATEAWSERGV
jgi:hypothetical protein